MRPTWDFAIPLCESRAASTLRICQTTSKTGLAETRKLVHLAKQTNPPVTSAVATSSLEPMVVETAVQTFQDVEAMLRLSAAGWGHLYLYGEHDHATGYHQFNIYSQYYSELITSCSNLQRYI